MFFRSHPKDRPIQSPLTTRMGTQMTYSNPDPHGACYQWRAEKLRPLLSAHVLWTGRYLYRAIPAVTRGLGFSCLICSCLSRHTRRSMNSHGSPFSRLLKLAFSRLLRHAMRCWGPFLTRFLIGFPFSHFRHARECWGPILTWILHRSSFSHLLRHARPALIRTLTGIFVIWESSRC
jgi:hypothetical protein